MARNLLCSYGPNPNRVAINTKMSTFKETHMSKVTLSLSSVSIVLVPFSLCRPFCSWALVMVFRAWVMQLKLYSIYRILTASSSLFRQSTVIEAGTSCISIRSHNRGFSNCDTLKEITDLICFLPFECCRLVGQFEGLEQSCPNSRRFIPSGSQFALWWGEKRNGTYISNTSFQVPHLSLPHCAILDESFNLLVADLVRIQKYLLSLLGTDDACLPLGHQAWFCGLRWQMTYKQN